MDAQAVLEPLIAAGVTATIRADARLVVCPAERITSDLDAYIRGHRDELIAALAAPFQPPQPLDWPPPEPAWFAEWMREDDARRTRTMAAAMQRRADHKHGQGAA